MITYPLEVYSALDSLNSWVRSRSARGWWNSPYRAIYDWKLEAIKAALKDGEATSSWIYLTLHCRDCGGSGRYTDSYGQKFPHCRRCSSTGKQRLFFLVTHLYGFVWHTPREKTWGLRGIPDVRFANLSIDWEPNRIGRDLAASEVARHLNILEPVMPKPGYTDWDSWDGYGEVFHGDYMLDLGRTDLTCPFCGKVSDNDRDGIYHGIHRGYLRWSAWACGDCKQKHVGVSIFDKFPDQEVTDPEILKWLERRALAGWWQRKEHAA